MKKLFVLLLCLSLLLLPACRTEPIVPPTGGERDYDAWNDFIWNSKWGKESSVEIQRTLGDGNAENVTVTYDGSKYTITDDAGIRSYAHLICDTHVEKSGNGYFYGDYFFLTDDPNMTFEQYQKAQSLSLQLQPTELVLGKTGTADSVECYGLVPKKIEKVLSAMVDGSGHALQYCENSFFISEYFSNKYFNGESDLPETNFTIKRYDYNGNLLCSVEIPDWRTNRITEFDDGSFIVTLEDYTDDGEAEVLYFSNNGELQWHYVYPAWHGARLSKFSQIGDDFYGFGGYHTGSYENPVDEIYIARFSEDGELLADVIAGGSGEESFVAAELSDNGFTLWGKTESSDGDFPVGSAKDAKLFHVEVGFDLTFSELTCPVQKEYSPYPYGYYKGNPVGWEDPLMQIQDSDRLPEKSSIYNTEGLIPWGTGYVILRHHQVEVYAFSHPMDSLPGTYRQIIATYYNAFGWPVWQTVSEPFLG